MRQAIGINDQSKELIRNAIHLSKVIKKKKKIIYIICMCVNYISNVLIYLQNNSKLKMGKTHSINVPNELPNNMDKKKKILHSTISNKEKSKRILLIFII